MESAAAKMNTKGLLINRLCGIRRDSGGQSLVFVALVLFTLVCFFALTVNVGHRIAVKVETQNAADAATLSGALWNARGLNMISILNVGMTECLALIIMFKAFDKTFTYAKTVFGVLKAIGKGICACPLPPCVVACTAWQICEGITTVVENVTSAINKAMQKLIDPLWKLMDALKVMEDGIKYAVPLVAAKEASRIAGLDGASHFFSFGGFDYNAVFLPFLSPLPVKDGVFRDLCPPTKSGGSGYDNFLCWESALGMKLPSPVGGELRHWIGLAHWLAAWACVQPSPSIAWYIFLETEYQAMCSGQDQWAEIESSTESCSVCNDNNGNATWKTYTGEISQSEYNNTQTGWQDNPCKRITRSQRVEWEDCYCSDPGCNVGCNPDSNGNTPVMGQKQVVKYYKTERIMEECVYSKKEKVESTDTSDKAVPTVLEDDWQEQVKYIGLVHQGFKGEKFPWWGSGREIDSLQSDLGGEDITFGEGGESARNSGAPIEAPEETYCFACAEIYNPTDKDLFNQDWHVRLTPCDADALKNGLTAFGFSVPIPSALTGFLNGTIGEVLIH